MPIFFFEKLVKPVWFRWFVKSSRCWLGVRFVTLICFIVGWGFWVCFVVRQTMLGHLPLIIIIIGFIRILVYIEAIFKSKITTFIGFMGIIALASFTNGTMNLPKEVKEALNIKDTKGKIVFVKNTDGKIYIEKA